MNIRKYIMAGAGCIIAICSASAQNEDKAVFRTSEPGFYQNTILQDDIDLKERLALPQQSRYLAVDLSGRDLPDKVNLYKQQQWYNPPISQGNTGTCWCFSTTSFLESEEYRIYHKEVKLSEMFTVYWEYVEKARRYVQERGNSLFDEGSEANAVTRIWKKYGVVPEDTYTGLQNGRIYHNHEAMVGEMKEYLRSLEETAAWDEDAAIATIRSILDHYMGAPPTQVSIDGKTYTPLQYLQQVLKLSPDDYVDILSYEQEPFFQQVEYKVPDNWWHNSDYYNVPLETFMTTLKEVVRNGYTVSIGGDVSEPGFDRLTQCAVVPDFDIPADYINDDARQFRFSNQTTTDDHGMHLVGYLEKEGKDWYLIKDSSSGSRNNDPQAEEFGFYFFSEDYVKLKMMDFMVHKDAVKDVLEMFR